MKRIPALVLVLLLAAAMLSACGSSKQPKGYYACASVRNTVTGESARAEGGYLFAEDGTVFFIESSGDRFGPFSYTLDGENIRIEDPDGPVAGTYKNETITIQHGSVEAVYMPSEYMPVRR